MDGTHGSASAAIHLVKAELLRTLGHPIRVLELLWDGELLEGPAAPAAIPRSARW